MENIEKFNTQAAKVFATLYGSFPEPAIIDCRAVVYGEPARDSVQYDDLQRDTTDRAIVFCTHVLKWLMETGYLKGDASLHHVWVHGAVLTPKGFEALAATPAAIAGEGSAGSRLTKLAKEGMKDGTKDAIKSQVSDIISFVIGWAIAHYR